MKNAKYDKTVDDYVEQIFPIKCFGRDTQGREVLSVPVNAYVNIFKSPGIPSS